jgi:hypothetical protein
VASLGQRLVWPLCLGFAIVPIYLHLQQRPAFAAALGWPVLSPDMVVNATGGEPVRSCVVTIAVGAVLFCSVRASHDDASASRVSTILINSGRILLHKICGLL